MNKFPLVLLLLFTIIFSGCSKKHAGIPWDLSDKNRLEIRELDFDYFSGKAKIDYKDNQTEVNAKATVRMKKDSLIWINFSAVGIQGARCLITRDSITIINLMQREYYVFFYDSLSKKFNFDITFEALQAVALGNAIFARTEEDYVVKKDDFFVLTQYPENSRVDNYVNRETMKLERVEMYQPGSDNRATIIYKDFHLMQDRAFPFSAVISLFYATEQGTLNTKIRFEYNKADFEEKELKFPFSINSKYVRK